jgi:hypothetical protein
MKVEATDANGQKHYFDAPELDDAAIDALNSQSFTRKQVHRIIDNMSVSADAKSILNSIVDTSIQVGEKIIQIGKKILEIVIELIKAYPKASIGVVIGLILGGLISAIPVVGFLFGWLLQPLLPALGMAMGWMQDFNDDALKRKIADIQQQFYALKGNEIRS